MASATNPSTSDNEPPAAWLELEDGARLTLGASTLLGSAVDARDGHRLVYPTVSRKHALVTAQEGGEFWLLDRGSTNGTYLNGNRLYGARRLQDGDRLGLGQSVRMVFRQPVSPEERRAGSMVMGTMVETWSEQRWLLIIDLKKSTSLTRSVPVADLPRVVGAWLNACRDLVTRCGGSISKYTGDGLMAFWRESDAAISQVARALCELEARLHDPPPFRFVVHRGEVMVGGGPSLGEECLFSSHLSFVVRLEELAKQLSASVLLSAAAAELLRGELPIQALPARHAIRDHDPNATVFTLETAEEDAAEPTPPAS